MENFQMIIYGVLLLVFTIMFVVLVKSISKNKHYEQKYSKIISIENEVEKTSFEKNLLKNLLKI